MGLWGSTILSSAGVSLVLLQLLVGARVFVRFGNDDQLLPVRRDSSGWFSLSVVPISYVVGVGCSSLLFSI